MDDDPVTSLIRTQYPNPISEPNSGDLVSERRRPEWLGMVALGANGGQPLADGGRL